MADIENPSSTNTTHNTGNPSSSTSHSRWANVRGIEKGVEDLRTSNRPHNRSSRNNHSNNSNLTPQNSRAALLGDAPDIRPHQQQQSFRRDHHSNRRESHNEEQQRALPMPVANSRFARAAESDRSERDRDNVARPMMTMRGPPPMAQNSRFAAAAEADRKDRDLRSNEGEHRSLDRPKIQQSRFAAAAREFERSQQEYQDNPSTRTSRPRSPPTIQNSRFAAAAEADAEERRAYEEAREARMREREEHGGGGGSRWGNVQRSGMMEGGSHGGGRGGRYGSRYGSRGGDMDDTTRLPRFPGDRGGVEEDLPRFPGDKGGSSSATSIAKKDDSVHELLKPKKPVEKVILPPVSAPLTLPGEDEEAARARIEKKKREEEERKQKEEEEARLAAEKKAEEERVAKEAAEKAKAAEGDILQDFANGDRLGDDLATWCKEQGSLLPNVEKLVFYYLKEIEANNPDKDCGWAKKGRLGSALLSLVSDDVLAQAQILFAIQKYCDWTGFPKCGDEYLVQSMFTNMYKYDLVEAEAFDYWKEDESDEHEVGKQKTLVQTIDWFNWLEEDDEGDYEDEYEY
jgi:hypothetical protein